MTLPDDYLRGMDKGVEKGRQEVVDTVWNESVGDPRITGYIRIVWKDWKAILKKWGVK